MSVLNKKPFIQTLIEGLSDEEKSALLQAINGETTKVKYSLILRDLKSSPAIESVLLETKTHLFNGYKIYKSNKIFFLVYNQSQDMSIYQIPYPYYEKELKGKINEPLTIEEMRRYLEGVGDAIEPAEISSLGANDGDVLTADGEGGTEWKSLPISNVSRIHNFEENTILTETILSQVKSGDIVKVNQMEFVVNNKPNESPRSITGKMVTSITTTSISVAVLEWVFEEQLSPTLITLSLPAGNEQEEVI